MDAFTGRPVPGAKVLLHWETNDGTRGGTAEATMAEDGTFSLDAREQAKGVAEFLAMETTSNTREARYATPEQALGDLEWDLRASAKGYATVEKGEPGPSVDIGLVPEGHDLVPGAVRVEARWPDGTAYAGRLLVDFWNERSGFLSQWALPESDGTFLVAGLSPGIWNIRVAGKRDSGEKVTVPEAGEARVALRVPRKGMVDATDAPAGEPREVEVSLGERRAGAGSFVRAEARPGLFFRVEPVAGTALFPALPAGKWEFVLQSPGEPETRFSAEVPAGAGRLSLRFP